MSLAVQTSTVSAIPAIFRPWFWIFGRVQRLTPTQEDCRVVFFFPPLVFLPERWSGPISPAPFSKEVGEAKIGSGLNLSPMLNDRWTHHFWTQEILLRRTNLLFSHIDHQSLRRVTSSKLVLYVIFQHSKHISHNKLLARKLLIHLLYFHFPCSHLFHFQFLRFRPPLRLLRHHFRIWLGLLAAVSKLWIGVWQEFSQVKDIPIQNIKSGIYGISFIRTLDIISNDSEIS